jgi:hypothetical protein
MISPFFPSPIQPLNLLFDYSTAVPVPEGLHDIEALLSGLLQVAHQSWNPPFLLMSPIASKWRSNPAQAEHACSLHGKDCLWGTIPWYGRLREQMPRPTPALGQRHWAGRNNHFSGYCHTTQATAETKTEHGAAGDSFGGRSVYPA